MFDVDIMQGCLEVFDVDIMQGFPPMTDIRDSFL